MAKAGTPEGQVRAWIEGVLAQAGDPRAAARTRPFLANLDRLSERYPDEQRESVELVLRLLQDALTGLEPEATADRVRLDAVSIYHLSVGTMHQHIRDGTRPGPVEIEHLIQFSLAAVASNGKGEPHHG
jgi:hypothetical protein